MAVGIEWHSTPPDLGVGAAGTTLHRNAPLVVAPRVGVGVVHQARLGVLVAVGGERGRLELLVTVVGLTHLALVHDHLKKGETTVVQSNKLIGNTHTSLQ